MAKGRRDACLQAGGGRAGVWVALDTHTPPAAAWGRSTKQLNSMVLEPRGFPSGVPPLRKADLLSEFSGSQHMDLCT